MIAAARVSDQDTTDSHGRTEGALINVTMEGDAIHIRPVGRVDTATMTTIRELLASAAATGTTAVVDVRDVDRRDRAQVAALGGVRPASVA